MFDFTEKRFTSTIFAMPDQGGGGSSKQEDDSGSGDDTDEGFE